MKKFVTISLFALLSLSVFGEDSIPRRHRHELGLDATGFLWQFLHLNGSQFPEYYEPNYYLTYRYHIGKCNLRSAIGGYFYHQPFESPFTNDPNSYERNREELSFRIGWEWTNELSKRWQAYYGIDYRQGYLHDKNDAPWWNGGYANGRETKSISYGIAPVLGFRFRLTPRLSLCTEASLLCLMETTESRRYYLSVDPQQFPPIDEVVTPKNTSYYTSFAQPLSVFITFDL